jgi:hypothetical protein
VRSISILIIVVLTLLVCTSCIFDSNDDKEHFLKGTIKDTDGNVITDARVYVVFDESWNTKGINDSLWIQFDFFVFNYEAGWLDWDNALIGWHTYTESNMLGFYVYRASCDNINSAAVVSPLIPATNTQEYHEYNFIDYDLPDGSYYYWLCAVELDNPEWMIVGPRMVYIHGYQPPPAWSFNNLPNPFTSYTWFSFASLDTCNVRIDISNPFFGFIKSIDHPISYPTSGLHRWQGTGGEGDNQYFTSNGLYQAKLTATALDGTELFTKTINVLINRTDINPWGRPVTYSSLNGYSIPYNKYFQFGKEFDAYDIEEWDYMGTYTVPNGFMVYIVKDGYETVSRHISISDYRSDRTEDFVLPPVKK